MSKTFFIDIYPIHWQTWSQEIAYVLASQNLPSVDEEHWREFAQSIASNSYFGSFCVPSPDHFDDWREWANQLLVCSNGKAQANV